MPMSSPAYKNHLRNLQNEINAEKYHKLQKLDLFNEKTFYRAFIDDMLSAKKEIIIYCPFISKFRAEFFSDTLKKLRRRNICVFIFTRSIEEHDYLMRTEIKCALKDYEELGVCITYLPGFIHAKVAIIDREIFWEGSLNILSQRESKEMMRRMADEDSAMQVMSYLGLNKKLAEGYKYQYERLYRSLVENSKPNFGARLKVVTKFITEIFVRFLFVVSGAMILILKGARLLMGLIGTIINSQR